MRILLLCFWPIAAISIVGCGPSAPTTPSSPTGLQLAGTYVISQAAVDDTCGMSSESVSFQGTVTHTAGAATFTLTDTVGTRFNGAVERDGGFTATATVGPDPNGQTYSERLEGRFTTSGFSATLRVDVNPRACRFTRSWNAAKQGAPNVFP